MSAEEKAGAERAAAQTGSKQVSEYAYAKINLSLDITGRRDDGYHLVSMVMQTVSLCDEVTVTARDDGQVVMTGLDLRPCAGKEAGEGKADLPSGPGQKIHTSDGLLTFGPDNLCVRAAEALREEYLISSGAEIHLEKRIPVAAGLAGGSADAAAVLRAMRKLFSIEASDEDLRKLALPLGADIPYCISGGTALCKGIGEEITFFPAFGPCPVVLVKPAFPISTAEAYGDYDRICLEQPELFKRPDNTALVQLLREHDSAETENGSIAPAKGERKFSGDWKAAFSKAMGNVLRDTAVLRHSEISLIEDELRSRGAFAARMSGSGPTVFGLFESTQKAEEAAMALAEMPGIESAIACRAC